MSWKLYITTEIGKVCLRDTNRVDILLEERNKAVNLEANTNVGDSVRLATFPQTGQDLYIPRQAASLVLGHINDQIAQSFGDVVRLSAPLALWETWHWVSDSLKDDNLFNYSAVGAYLQRRMDALVKQAPYLSSHFDHEDGPQVGRFYTERADVTMPAERF